MDLNKLQPGPELDRLVAEKVMGWPIVGNKWVGFELGAVWGNRPTAHADNWNPSTDMSHAWMVVERLRLSARKWELVIFQQTSTETGEEVGPWGAYFSLPEAPNDDSLYGHGTAPQAICIAALKAVGAVPSWSP